MTTDTLVFAPDAIIRARGGRLLIHTTSSPLPAFETENPMLVGWLCQFARPLAADAAIKALQPSEQGQVAQVVEYLQRSGALVAAGGGAAAAPNSAPLAKQHLRALARTAYEVGCDILAEGERLEASLEQRAGVGLERRLLALLAALDGLRAEVHEVRDQRIAQQLAALGIGPQSRDLKLHIGCGPGLLEGWINIDVAPAPLAVNIIRGLPLPDQCAHYVFVSHALEHLFFPADVAPFLRELRRVLQPGGVARIVVPDIELCIAAYPSGDQQFFASRRETWSWWPANPTRLEDFLGYAGAGAEPAFSFESHKYGYDLETLHKVLQQAGFAEIVRSAYMQSSHGALRVDDVSSVAKAKFGDRHYSLFVEARKP